MTTRQMRVAVWGSVIALSFAASISGITNGFAFDDVHIIVIDSRTHSLAHWWQLFAQSYWPIAKGGDLYRPLTVLGFAVQWAIGGGSPLVFHIFSIVLYALVCAAFLGILLELLPIPAAWVGAALFAVHPLHVESVGNVVGQAELLVALFVSLALLVFLKARRRGDLSLRDTCLIVVLFALGCLSKEHALVLPLMLIAAEATVVASQFPLRARLASIRPLMLALGATGLAFLWARTQVLGGTGAVSDEANALFFDQSYGVRIMTMSRVALEWMRLFLWPAHLSADYSPRVIELVTSPNIEMFGSVAILIGIAGFAWAARRSAPVATFAFLWTAIALIIPSNLIVPTGFALAERTLFLATGGVMLGAGAVVAHFGRHWPELSQQARRIALVAIAAVLLAGVGASASRQRVWRDDDTLFAQTIVDVPSSYKAHLAQAAMLFEKNQRKAAFEEIGLAHALFPSDLDVLQYAAEQYSSVEGCRLALGLFARILATEPRRAETRVGYVKCLTAMGRFAEARKTIRQGLATGESMRAFRRLAFVNDSLETTARTRAGRR